MTQLDTLNLNDLYQEIVELAREQGVADQATWDELCDEVIDSHAELAELNTDQNTEAYRTQLHAMWGEYKLEAGEETLGSAGEDPDFPKA